MEQIEEKTKNKHQARSNSQQITDNVKVLKISRGRAEEIYLYIVFVYLSLY